MSYRTTRVIVASAVCVLGIALGGCGGDDADSGAPPGPDAGIEAQPEAEPQDTGPDVVVDSDPPDEGTDSDLPDAPPQLVAPEFDLPTLETDMEVLTSDEYAGRAPATPGGDLALDYVEGLFAGIGLEPAGDEPGSYRQAFPFRRYEHLSDPTVTWDGEPLVSGQDFSVAFYSDSGQVSAEVVFVGYGLVVPPFDATQYPDRAIAPEGFDEYGEVDVAGKIALFGMAGHESELVAGCPVEYGGDRLQAAYDHGAAAAMAVPGELYAPETIRGLGTPNGSNGMPIASLGRGLVEAKLPDFATWMADIDTQRTPQSRALGIDASIDVNAQIVDTVSYNLIGKLPGTDPVLGKETVMLSGHIDHLGQDEVTGAVYAGANDNASGTVAALRLAEELIAKYGQPRRTVLVAAWNAEEYGLVGSCYYAEHPLHSLLYTVAMLNIEMLCSGDPTTMDVYGKDDPTTSWLYDLMVAGNAQLGTPVTPVSIPMGADSDHWCFLQHGVPAVSVGGGFENGPYASAPGYHTPADSFENFVVADMQRGMESIWSVFATLAMAQEAKLLAGSSFRHSMEMPRQVPLGNAGRSQGGVASSLHAGIPASHAH